MKFKILTIISLCLLFINVLYSQEDYCRLDFDLYCYMKKEFDFIKTNKIKTIKRNEHKEYYNSDGELTKIEYGVESVWGTVEIIKRNDRYFYIAYEKDIKESNSENIWEISREFFIYKGWPFEETIVETEIVLFDAKIEIEYSRCFDERIAVFYIYNEDDKVDKKFTFSYSYEYYLPMVVPENFKMKILNKNIIPELYLIKKYNYGENGKLESIEYNDIKNNKLEIIKIEYNERGLVTKDDNGELIEYEYYD